MNIFLTSPDPRECAIALDDKRVVKMAVETAQLLCTALDASGVPTGPGTGLYKPTHTMHPCSRWAARSRENFAWLVSHGFHLCKEYQFRYGKHKVHKADAVIMEALRAARQCDLPTVPLVFDFNSSGFDTGDVFFDYKLCLVNKWKHVDGFVTARSRKPVWTVRPAPAFKRELWDTDFNQYVT